MSFQDCDACRHVNAEELIPELTIGHVQLLRDGGQISMIPVPGESVIKKPIHGKAIRGRAGHGDVSLAGWLFLRLNGHRKTAEDVFYVYLSNGQMFSTFL